MKRLVLIKESLAWKGIIPIQNLFELSLSLFVGLLFGAMVVIDLVLPLPRDWQEILMVIPFALAVVMLVHNLEKLILAVIAIGVPLNLDVSVIVSPYSRNPENIASGYRTLITLAELRVSLVLITLVIGYALWLIRPKDAQHKPIRFFSATTVPALGFIFISVLSIIQAQDTQLWFFRIAQLVEVFLAYFYLANHIRTIHDMQFFAVVLLGGMLAESLLMIVQWITGLTFAIAGLEAMTQGPGRIGGTLGNPGPAAGYLSAMALVACAMIWGFPKRSQKILAAVSMGLGTVALIGTGSRIGWIAFAVTMLAYLFSMLRFGWIKKESLILLVIGMLAFGAVFYGAIYSRITADDNGSADSRPMMWRLAWNVITIHPWLGVGAGNYALVTRDYYTPDVGDPAQVLDIQVHNAYLDVWADSGIFALLCYLGFLGIAIIKAWSCANSRSRFVSLMGIGLSLAILSLCIQMVTGTFHLRSITLFLWILVALAASLPNIDQAHCESIVET